MAGDLRFAARVKGYFDPDYRLGTQQLSEAEKLTLNYETAYKVSELRRCFLSCSTAPIAWAPARIGAGPGRAGAA